MAYRPSFIPGIYRPSEPASSEEGKGLSAAQQSVEEEKPVLFPIAKGEQLTTGEFTRYFARLRSDKVIFEISIKSFLKARSKPVEYNSYDLAEVRWNATNPRTDQLINSYIKEGSNTVNYRNVLEVEKTFKGIFNLVQRDKTLKTTYLYTEGTQYKTRDGKAYKGYFHLTLKDGPCVNAEPIEGSVIKLYPISKVFSKFDK